GSVPYFDTGETLSSVETSYVESKGDVGDEEDKGLWTVLDIIQVLGRAFFLCRLNALLSNSCEVYMCMGHMEGEKWESSSQQ
ncbi:hypothetical protein L195_g036708, partial [Trifolium pratense]